MTEQHTSDPSDKPVLRTVSPDRTENEKYLNQVFDNCADIVFRSFNSCFGEILIVYVDGLADTKELDKRVIKPLTRCEDANDSNVRGRLDGEFRSKDELIEFQEIVKRILYGETAVFAEGLPCAIMIQLIKFEHRSVSEPQLESSIRGPREAFTEVLQTNLSLLRRKFNTPELKMEEVQIGELTRTRVMVSYLADEVNMEILAKVKEKLTSIKSKAILDANYIEESIEGSSFSLFPQIQNTERPDTVAASVIEGKIAIFVDGSPNVLLAPMTFWSGFQAADDHYERFLYVSAVRIIRIVLFILSLLLPSFYVALTTYHPQMIPNTLLISIAAAREGVPFPTVIETFIMEIMFEGLREAGLRLPRAVGSAVSIVGALVIGESAVQAGFISAPIVIIVASTGIASFAIPRYNLSLPFRLLRFLLLGLAGSLGFYGIAAGTTAILIHLCILESFGVPYLAPLASSKKFSAEDTLYRAPKKG
ncbi:spore germination protein [Paenibacillus glycanilyticus]|uniref:spore germination protein n=1 Tax=Paenibacillus glycanilyticus TaxID=126569 RepID=UPI002040F35F|nr:spore germination protein [Paenibacillus glycanilyticus]MCM3628409.1 spore germination protein [Paenibacillus glycanilyticus]